MSTVAWVAEFLGRIAPQRLAETWDNVGLLVGRRDQNATRIMTCLTVTPAVAAEAIREKADLIVTHHPMPFAATKRLTDETTVGRLLLDLIAAGVAIYSAHTAFDSAAQGINQRLAEGLGLSEIVPLLPHIEGQGTGRCGRLTPAVSLAELADRLKQQLGIIGLCMVGSPQKPVSKVATACGAADELLRAAREAGCDAMVIGEARFHTCLEAEASGIALLLPGHFASERFGVEALAQMIARQFSEIHVWASRDESDPISWRYWASHK